MVWSFKGKAARSEGSWAGRPPGRSLPLPVADTDCHPSGTYGLLSIAPKMRPLFSKIWILFLPAIALGCGQVPVFPLIPTSSASFEPFPIATLPLSFDVGDLGSFPGPTWQLPDVPDSVLSPFAGDPPEWWHWVPIHPATYGGGEAGAGFHYLVDVAPLEMLSYYKEILRQAGWEERMGELVVGDYSLLSYDRYSDSVTIYISPRDLGSLVSVVLN